MVVTSEDKVRAYKERMRACIEMLKQRLYSWIEEQGGAVTARYPGAPYSTEVTAALLETAIDRQIELLGESDARDLAQRCFDRRAAAYRRTLN